MSFSKDPAYDSVGDNINGPSILRTITSHHLIVTTAGGVYSWSNRGSAQLLLSTSKGIVSTRNMHVDKDLLAVADSQVVVLHNMEKGLHRTYRLRNEDQGFIRKLFYHPDKQRLFFTTTLQNAVQSFSLRNVELLDPAPVHPSPPTVFAVSPTCDLLVSASRDPPTIYLSRITCKQPPLVFVPNCSNTAVVSICFHPTRANIFVLGFEDGTLAAYNATPLPVPQLLEDRFSYAKIYGEISHIAGLHSHAHQASRSNEPFESKQSSTTNVPTISGIQFLPKQLCSVASVGADRNCFIVDFQKHGRNTAEIVGTWNLHGAATSLALLELASIFPQTDGQDDGAETNNVLLAVGKSDGTVSVYSKSGQLLATKDFSKDGRVLDLEWAQRSKNQVLPVSFQQANDNDTKPLRVQPQQQHEDKSEDTTPSKGSRSPPASKIMVKLHVASPVPDDYLLKSKGSLSSTEEPIIQGTSSLDGNAISVPEKRQSDITTKSQDTDLDIAGPEDYTTAPETKSSTSHYSRSQRSSRTTNRSAASSVSSRKRQIPVVPSRPVPRPGGKLASRRVESTRGRRVSSAVGSPAHRKIVRTAVLNQFKFEDLDHDLPAPPNLHQRYASSNISPLSEVPKLDYLASSMGSHAPVISPLASELPVLPLQYNRLTGPSLDAAPSSSISRPSLLQESGLGHHPVIAAKINELRKDSLPLSDSSTSVGSVLDWTPAAHIGTNMPQKRAPSLPQLKSKEMASPVRPLIQRQNHYQESDSSPASQLDWHDGRELIKVEGFDMLTPHQSSKSPSVANKQRRSTPISPLAPFQNFRLRKIQTAINLKDKNAPPPRVSPVQRNPASLQSDSPPHPASSNLSSHPNLMKPLPPPSTNNVIKSTQSSRQMRSSNSTAGWQSTYTIEDVIRIECAAVCTRVEAGFDEHKAWLQSLLREQNWFTVRLEEENRLLREELARLRKG